MASIRTAPRILIVVALLGVAVTGHAQRPRTSPRSRAAAAATQTPEAKRRIETFEKVWQTISDHYYDKNFNNLNWNSIRTEYGVKVRAVKNDTDLHHLLYQMISRLGSSHLAIIPPEVYLEIERAKTAAKARLDKDKGEPNSDQEEESEEEDEAEDPLAQYGIGVDLRIIGGQFVITRVEKNSAAERAGLKTGYVLEKINDLSLSAMLLRLSEYYANSRGLINQIPSEVIDEFINGEKDSYVDLTYLDGADFRKQASIRRELLRGQIVTIGKGFPEKHLEFEAYALTPEIGYVRFNQFAMPVVEKFCDAIGKLRGTRGMIVDLRGNGGGLIAAAVGLSGMLSENPVDLGTSIYKWSEQNLKASPKVRNYKGRLIFLVDETTASAAEMFAVSFQENGRGLVVGEKSAGATLPSVVIDLPTGAVMQYPIANYRSSKGVFLEGKGITPNFVVSLDRNSLSRGSDAQLDKALGLFSDNKAFADSNPAKPAVPVSFSAAAPPPPPPPAKIIGEGTVKPPPPVSAPITGAKDPEAVRIIEEFVKLSGGRDAIAKIDTYEIAGKAQMNINGAIHDFDYTALKKSSDKYAEVMSADGLGEMREVYNGRSHLTQTDFGHVQEMPLPESIDVSKLGLLAHIRLFAESGSLASLKYMGTYTRDGRKVHLIDGKGVSGTSLAFTFDVETKMLTYLTGPVYGMVLGDYRKVGDLTLPFAIERESLMRLRIESIKVNQPIDDAKFARKKNCYDIPN